MIEAAVKLKSHMPQFNFDRQVVQDLFGAVDAVDLTPSLASGSYVRINDMNSGAIANSLEYESRLAEYLTDMIYFDRSEGDYLNFLGRTWLQAKRPLGLNDDEKYKSYTISKILGQKESSLSIEELLEPHSSEEVKVLESTVPRASMFIGVSYLGFYKKSRRADADEVITPSVLGAAQEDNNDLYYFRVKLQPKTEIDQKIIIELLQVSYVAGVRYDIELYEKPSWA